MSDYPSVNYPTILEGYVSGDRLRLESLDGREMILTETVLKVFTQAIKDYPGITYDGKGFILRNAGPFIFLNITVGISHLQKYSKWGWLKVSPDCFHRWYFWKLQEKDSNGGWIPGSERGIYLRKGTSLLQWKCWRWQVNDAKGISWIRSNGFLGGHLD